MHVQLSDLPWLPAPPGDFRERVKRLREQAVAPRTVARFLSGFRLNGGQLHALAKPVESLADNEPGAIRLGVLSNSNTDLICPALSVSALRHGVWLRTVRTAFDQVASEALDINSRINRAKCQYVLLAVDHRGLPFEAAPGNEERARASVAAALKFVDSLRQGLRRAAGCTVIFQTTPQVTGALFGSLERCIPGTMQWLIDHYNAGLRSLAFGSSDLLLDIAALAESIGLARWHDAGQWALGKFAFAHEALPIYADHVGRLIGAASGKSRKCLVLDLDNTLWGGVIGDDGLEGITLGNGSAVGEAFLLTQQTALTLRERGIVLAVSSKNDDEVARSAFRSHPEMLLKERHIAVFQANWKDKASNLRAIAEHLKFGLDALVLLDDNPAEREQVRVALPEVAVPEMPDDPALHGATLLAGGYFESVSFTEEDGHRADQYEMNAARAELKATSPNLSEYLRSLEMRLTCRSFDSLNRGRITQLINKSNQFNLTTRRYSEAEVAALEKSPRAWTAQLRLTDRFGDNGIIGVVICLIEVSGWVVDTWLMSCRVLNRQVEQATLNYIVSQASARNAERIIGLYRPTERNGIVKDHYSKLGFQSASSSSTCSRWELETQSYRPIDVPIQILGEESL